MLCTDVEADPIRNRVDANGLQIWDANEAKNQFLKHLGYMWALFWIITCCLLEGAQIETFYGPIEVEEPVLLELIESPAFQRLKHIHQYGVAYYTTHSEEYTRYDHSLGVFAILRAKNCSLEEQIAGLLHDVSHTAFSHVGDWIFGKENQEKDYQNSIHQSFLQKSGLEEILKKHHFLADQMLPTKEAFPALEQPSPNLCADRIDYNIQGAYYQGFITYEEAKEIFDDLHFVDGDWLCNSPSILKKLAKFSLFMTENCWGSPANYLSSRSLANAILRGIDLGCITYDDIHFGTDQAIWDQLMRSEDPLVRQQMDWVTKTNIFYALIDDPGQADIIIKSKFRGIDPWVIVDGKCMRLTTFDPTLAQEFKKTKEKIEKGWMVKLF